MKPIILLILLILGIVFISNAESYYVTHTAYVRAGKGIRYKTIGIVHKGATVEVVEISGSWAKITNNKQYGFINSKFLMKASTSRSYNQDGPNYFGAVMFLLLIVCIVVGIFQGNSSSNYKSSRADSNPNGSDSLSGFAKDQADDDAKKAMKDADDLVSGKRKLLERED